MSIQCKYIKRPSSSFFLGAKIGTTTTLVLKTFISFLVFFSLCSYQVTGTGTELTNKWTDKRARFVVRPIKTVQNDIVNF